MDPGTILSILDIVNKSVQFLAGVVETLVDAPKALTGVIRETNQLRQLLEYLAGIQRGLPSAEQRFLDGQVSTAECKATVMDLWRLVEGIRPLKSDTSSDSGDMKFTERVKWLRNQSKIEKLVEKLSKQEDHFQKILTSAQLKNVDGKEDETHRLLQIIILRMSAETPAKTLEFDSGDGVFSPYKAEGITWHGQFRCKPGQDLSMPYFRHRNQLADAIYFGDWDGVMKELDRGRHSHKQRWANCRRIFKSHETGKMPSGFTPLHQAAWHGNEKAVKSLLHMGAWRLARTLKEDSEGTLADSTPLEVARAHKWEHLYELLNPVIRRPLSHKVLSVLQDRLHDLIRQTFGPEKHPEAHLECFLLPELEILTEFDRSRLWFPLNPELKDTRDGLTVHVILDENELVAVMRWGRQERRNYRISASGVQEIQQAIILT